MAFRSVSRGRFDSSPRFGGFEDDILPFEGRHLSVGRGGFRPGPPAFDGPPRFVERGPPIRFEGAPPLRVGGGGGRFVERFDRFDDFGGPILSGPPAFERFEPGPPRWTSDTFIEEPFVGARGTALRPPVFRGGLGGIAGSDFRMDPYRPGGPRSGYLRPGGRNPFEEDFGDKTVIGDFSPQAGVQGFPARRMSVGGNFGPQGGIQGGLQGGLQVPPQGGRPGLQRSASVGLDTARGGHGQAWEQERSFGGQQGGYPQQQGGQHQQFGGPQQQQGYNQFNQQQFGGQQQVFNQQQFNPQQQQFNAQQPQFNPQQQQQQQFNPQQQFNQQQQFAQPQQQFNQQAFPQAQQAFNGQQFAGQFAGGAPAAIGQQAQPPLGVAQQQVPGQLALTAPPQNGAVPAVVAPGAPAQPINLEPTITYIQPEGWDIQAEFKRQHPELFKDDGSLQNPVQSLQTVVPAGEVLPADLQAQLIAQGSTITNGNPSFSNQWTQGLAQIQQAQQQLNQNFQQQMAQITQQGNQQWQQQQQAHTQQQQFGQIPQQQQQYAQQQFAQQQAPQQQQQYDQQQFAQQQAPQQQQQYDQAAYQQQVAQQQPQQVQQQQYAQQPQQQIQQQAPVPQQQAPQQQQQAAPQALSFDLDISRRIAGQM